MIYIYLAIFLILCGIIVGQEHNLEKGKNRDSVSPIDNEIYSNLYTYAHLIDISYCISSTSRIGEPFECELSCEKRFPNVTLAYQWYFDDSVCGYIATTNSNIFDYENASNSSKKTIIVSLRGTRSIFDTFTDLKTDLTDYVNVNSKLPACGDQCKVHQGFYDYFLRTLAIIQRVLLHELINTPDDYELLIVGHSMGGAIGLFISLHFLDLGFDKMTLVTMGQPLVGNKQFVNWVDDVMGSRCKAKHNSFDRKYLRIIHKGDIVTVIPNNRKNDNNYYQFENQIYLNCSASNPVPSLEKVVDCQTASNQACIAKDFKTHDSINRNYFESHNTYFRKLGLCGMRIRPNSIEFKENIY